MSMAESEQCRRSNRSWIGIARRYVVCLMEEGGGSQSKEQQPRCRYLPLDPAGEVARRSERIDSKYYMNMPRLHNKSLVNTVNLVLNRDAGRPGRAGRAAECEPCEPRSQKKKNRGEETLGGLGGDSSSRRRSSSPHRRSPSPHPAHLRRST